VLRSTSVARRRARVLWFPRQCVLHGIQNFRIESKVKINGSSNEKDQQNDYHQKCTAANVHLQLLLVNTRSQE
jgi:hypothetical protein